jgi:hypothetical protein
MMNGNDILLQIVGQPENPKAFAILARWSLCRIV